MVQRFRVCKRFAVFALTSVDHSAPGCTHEAPCEVGEDQLWMMGDNRDHSADSRKFGPIERDTVVGRAFVNVWPLRRLGGL